MANALRDLADAGVAVWLDDLSRGRISSGSLSKMVDRGDIVGITTNPTIFAKAIGEGDGYDDQIYDFAVRGVSIGEAVRLVTSRDVRDACDVLRPVFAATDGLDGRVSIEVDPRIAQKAAATAAEARALWWLVDRPNLFIKIPATVASLPAISQTIAAGISVNVTLIFSLERYRAVLDAYMTGLEERADRGASLSGLESVASFFVSRVDTEVDRRLALKTESLRSPDERHPLTGQAAIANSRLAYELYQEASTSERWLRLASKGAKMQRLLWASTGVKDKTFPDTRYVTDLVAPSTVNTMPEATLEAVRDHGVVTGEAIGSHFRSARKTLEHLKEAGVDLDDVARTLEEAGLATFEKSWEELIASVTKRIEAAGATVTTAGVVTPQEDGGERKQPAAGPAL